MSDRSDVMNVKETAAFLGTHIETVRRLARRGDLPSFKVGKDWRFRRDALLKWTEAQQPTGQPEAVLVVDDDKGVRFTVRRILEPTGLVVHEAVNGVEGLALMDRHDIAAVLLDLQMPDMNGPEFLKSLRRDNRDTPVIVVTGYPDGDLMAEAARYGPVMLVTKPVQKNQLLQAVGGVLKRVVPDRA